MICTTFLFVILGGAPSKTAHDLKIQNSVAFRCKKIYDGCLHRLYRTEPRVYRAICRDPKGNYKVERYKIGDSMPKKPKIDYTLGDVEFLKGAKK